MGTGSSVADVYKVLILCWYNLMDTFIRKSYEHKETSNTNDTSLTSQDIVLECIENAEKIKNLANSTTPILDVLSTTPRPKKTTKKSSDYIELASNKFDNIEKRARLEKKDDDLDNFGKCVASSLRILNTENSIHAQDEIQAILTYLLTIGRYGPVRTLASFSTAFHSSLSKARSLHLLTPSLLMSVSTSSSHLKRGRALFLLPLDYHITIFWVFLCRASFLRALTILIWRL
ncbi:uncharacterized protein [Rhodnius prolixus]|uniref:uncharacterized protein n=1 Tax=Rhodnius prolixus TaxID=13249 RepID=UPI003D18D7B5